MKEKLNHLEKEHYDLVTGNSVLNEMKNREKSKGMIDEENKNEIDQDNKNNILSKEDYKTTSSKNELVTYQIPSYNKSIII